MRYIKFFCTFFILSVVSSCAQPKEYLKDRLNLEVTLKDFGKCKPLSKAFFNTTNIKEKYVTSAFYGFINDNTELITIPINDEVFNYKYFRKNIYPNLSEVKKVKLRVKKYLIGNKDVYVAEKIE